MRQGWAGRFLRRVWKPAALLVGLVGGYWLLPISGQVMVIPGSMAPAPLWPQMRLDPPAPQPGQPTTVWVTDVVPWAHVMLTVDGQAVPIQDWQANPDGTWTWRWAFAASGRGERGMVFYHSCDTGCAERSRMVVGTGQLTPPAQGVPTKLGLVFASPQRDWHGRSGWDIEPLVLVVTGYTGRCEAIGLPGQRLAPASD